MKKITVMEVHTATIKEKESPELKNSNYLLQQTGKPVSLPRVIPMEILGTQYQLEIMQLLYVLENISLKKYTAITNCAFVNVLGRSILAVEFEKNMKYSRSSKIVIAQVRQEKNCMLMGFIVNSLNSFLERIS